MSIMQKSLITIDPGSAGGFISFEKNKIISANKIVLKKDSDLMKVIPTIFSSLKSPDIVLIEVPIKKTGNSLQSVVRQWEIFASLRAHLAAVFGPEKVVEIQAKDWTKFAKNRICNEVPIEPFELGKKVTSEVYIKLFHPDIFHQLKSKRGKIHDAFADCICIRDYYLWKKTNHI